MDLDFNKHFKIAWNVTIANIIPLVLMTLVALLIGGISLGLLAPVVLAGYMHSILLAVRGERKPEIQDVFSHFGTLFFPLLLFAVVICLLMSAGFVMLVLPGLFVAFAVCFCCLYMLPLMTDRGLDVIEAVKESYRMATKDNIGEHVVVVLIVIGISSIGGSTFILSLFTQPFVTAFVMSIYNEKTKFKGRF